MSASPSAAAPARKRFALSGRSATIDPRVDAVRPDLADVRLAERVFAPHYAAPLPRPVVEAAELRLGRDADSEVIATLQPGSIFEILELAGTHAWGVAAGVGLVGYIPATTLDPAQ